VLEGWKVLTHDRRLPGPGNPHAWSGTLHDELTELPELRSPGWSFHVRLSTTLRASGLWPLGRPSIIVKVCVPEGTNTISIGDFAFARRLRVIGVADESEVAASIEAISQVFEPHGAAMTAEQLAWRQAFARPSWDPDAVEMSLGHALAARGLDEWRLERMPSGPAAWEAWAGFAAAARDEAMAARDDFGVRDAFQAKDAWAARRPPDPTWRAWEPWTTPDGEYRANPESRQFQEDLGSARAAIAAHFAMTLRFASYQKWIPQPPDLLTVGLRDAYRYGLEIAVPTARQVLGWAMADRRGEK
jgi:hypothetical protein